MYVPGFGDLLWNDFQICKAIVTGSCHPGALTLSLSASIEMNEGERKAEERD